MSVGVLDYNRQLEWNYAERVLGYRIACCVFIRAGAGGRSTAVLRKFVFLCRGVQLEEGRVVWRTALFKFLFLCRGVQLEEGRVV